MKVTVLYRDGAREEHFFNADKGEQAREFCRTATADKRVVKAVLGEA